MPNNRDITLWKYNIPKERYRYLHYFCAQYTFWKKQTKYGVSSSASDGMPKGNKTGNPTEQAAFRNLKYIDNINLVEKTCREADAEIYDYLLKNVTKGTTYEYMNVPCGRNRFYSSRRKFYYMLDLKLP